MRGGSIGVLAHSAYASVNCSSAHHTPPPPRADPRELGFFENKLANAPPPGQKSCSNAPGSGAQKCFIPSFPAVIGWKANARPPGWKVWENAPLLPGGGGGGGWALLELTDALRFCATL